MIGCDFGEPRNSMIIMREVVNLEVIIGDLFSTTDKKYYVEDVGD